MKLKQVFSFTSIILLTTIITLFVKCKKSELNVYTTNNYSVTNSGKTINSETGVTIVIPRNATYDTINLTVTRIQQTSASLFFFGGSTYPSAGDIFKIENDNRTNLDSCAIVTMPYNPNNISDPSKLGVAYYSDSLLSWIPADIFKVDTKNHKISFYTAHFSEWVPCYLNFDSKLLVDFDTKFTPFLDGFSFQNSLPPPYDSDLFGLLDGNCAGFAALSIWYYAYYKDITGYRLNNLSFRGTGANWTSIPQYKPLFEGIHKTQEQMLGWSAIKTNWKSVNTIGIASDIYNALITLKLPVYLGIQNSNKNSGHAVVVYKYESNNDGTGTFYFYDPNYPYEEKTFTHNNDGTINSFSYANATLKSSYLYVSSALGGSLSQDYVSSIFRKYFYLDLSYFSGTYSGKYNYVMTVPANFESQSYNGSFSQDYSLSISVNKSGEISFQPIITNPFSIGSDLYMSHYWQAAKSSGLISIDGSYNLKSEINNTLENHNYITNWKGKIDGKIMTVSSTESGPCSNHTNVSFGGVYVGDFNRIGSSTFTKR